MEFSVLRSIDMLMKSAVGAVRGYIRFQAGGGFQPVVDVMAGHAATLLVEVISVIADIVFGRRGNRSCWASGGLVSHRCCCFRHKESVAHV